VCTTVLELHIPLNGDIGAIDTGSVNGHINIGRPVRVLPLEIQAVIGLEVGSQGAVVADAALPFHRHFPVAVQRWGHPIVGINLLRDGDLLVVRRRRELDVCLVIVVVDNDVAVIVLQVEAWCDGYASTVGIKSLGSFHTLNVKVLAATGDHVHRQVGLVVVRVQFKARIGKVRALDLGPGRNAPAGHVRAGLAPNGLWERRNVRRGSHGCLDAVGNVHVSRLAVVGPGEGGVEAIEAVEFAVADRDLCERTKHTSAGVSQSERMDETATSVQQA
jgi:hypothetical protein